LSTKAAYAWATLFNDHYASTLQKSIRDLYNEKKGWYAGRYDKDGEINKALTANTNGVILEAIYYKLHGPILKINYNK
jgi:hypothetical protein